jgi:hypothetical protein
MSTENRHFQWLVGERRGEILLMDSIAEDDGMIFIEFKDNSRMSEEFIMNLNETDATGKFMAEIENPSKCWTFEEKMVGEETGRIEKDWESQVNYEIPSVTEIMTDGAKVPVKKKQVTLIPPAKTRQAVVESRFGTIVQAPVVAAPVVVSINPDIPDESSVSQMDRSDPVYIMMDKAKKVDTEVDMTLIISLPTQSLFDVIKDSFEDGGSKGLEYIIESIDISKIKESLKKGIDELFNNKETVPKVVEIPMTIPNWAPDVVVEPIIRDAKGEELELSDLAKELKDKSDKIKDDDNG